MMPRYIGSFRDYVRELEALDELGTIDRPVSWNLEIGAITRRAYELPSRAPLFTNIVDAEPGFRVLGAPVGLSPHPDRRYTRIALSLGLPPETSAADLVDAWSRLPDSPRLPVRRVATGACKQNIRLGDQIDLTRLPAPFIHAGDGGRYINTYGIVIAASPDGDVVNWAVARTMLCGERTMATAAVPGQHLYRLINLWRAAGKDMPFALALGVAPAIAMVGGYPLDDGCAEREVLGGWVGEPLEVVACETNPLEVPVDSEIVLEGTVSVTDFTDEGPMGEYAGYRKEGHRGRAPVYTVEAMTFRNDPILPVVASGVPPEENHTNWGIGIAAAIQHALRTAGLPVGRCFIPFESAVHWAVVALERLPERDGAAELLRRIGETVFGCRAGRYVPKLFVVGPDIDPSDLPQFIWALATRHHPEDTILFPDSPTIPLVAYLSEDDRARAASTKAVYSCLPHEGSTAGSLTTSVSVFADYPDELKRRILDTWSL